MKKLTNVAGYTVVEFLVVLTLLGIIATITISQYNLYSIRAKVAEMIQISYNAKHKMNEYIMLHKKYPLTMQSAGITDTDSTYVENLSINDTGAIILTSKKAKLGTDITIILQASVKGDIVTWKCSGLGDIAKLPKSCR